MSERQCGCLEVCRETSGGCKQFNQMDEDMVNWKWCEKNVIISILVEKIETQICFLYGETLNDVGDSMESNGNPVG